MRRIYISRGAPAISHIHNNKKQERKTPSHNIGHLSSQSVAKLPGHDCQSFDYHCKMQRRESLLRDAADILKSFLGEEDLISCTLVNHNRTPQWKLGLGFMLGLGLGILLGLGFRVVLEWGIGLLLDLGLGFLVEFRVSKQLKASTNWLNEFSRIQKFLAFWNPKWLGLGFQNGQNSIILE